MGIVALFNFGMFVAKSSISFLNQTKTKREGMLWRL